MLQILGLFSSIFLFANNFDNQIYLNYANSTIEVDGIIEII